MQWYYNQTIATKYDPNIPLAHRMDWATKRYVTLRVRHYIDQVMFRENTLAMKLNIYLQQHRHGAKSSHSGGFYWVADHKTVHFGPCPICTEMEERFRNKGAPMEYLMNIMNSPQHQAIHRRSRIKRPVCYCQILTKEEANRQGIMLFGDQSAPTGTGYGRFSPEEWAAIRRIVQLHYAETEFHSTKEALKQLAHEARFKGRSAGAMKPQLVEAGLM